MKQLGTTCNKFLQIIATKCRNKNLKITLEKHQSMTFVGRIFAKSTTKTATKEVKNYQLGGDTYALPRADFFWTFSRKHNTSIGAFIFLHE